MKLSQVSKLAGLMLCVSSVLWTAHAAPESVSVKRKGLQKERGIPASRLRLGDVIFAMYAPTTQSNSISTSELSFKSTAKVVSLSPLTININGGKTSITAPKGTQKEIGDFGVMTFTGQRSGFLAFVTVTQPASVKFDRLAK